MTGFDELVERSERDLARSGVGAGGQAGAPLEDYLQRQQQFVARLRAELASLEGHLDLFDLDTDRTTSRVRRFVAKRLRGLLRAGGLGKHLGANQLQANRSTLGALRLIQERLLDQDRILAELAATLAADSRATDGDGPRP